MHLGLPVSAKVKSQGLAELIDKTVTLRRRMMGVDRDFSRVRINVAGLIVHEQDASSAQQ
jgi:hypothetical protein